MIKEFKDLQVRKSGVIYQSTWEQIKKLYGQNPEMAGELAISVIEQTLTGDISSTDLMIQIICEGLKPINQNAQQKYDSRVRNNREYKRETQQLDKIAELINMGKTQEEIGKILGVSRQTINTRVKTIRDEYPELIEVNKSKDVNSCNHNDNVNDNDNVNEDEDEDGNEDAFSAPVLYSCEGSRVIGSSKSVMANKAAAPATAAASFSHREELEDAFTF